MAYATPKCYLAQQRPVYTLSDSRTRGESVLVGYSDGHEALASLAASYRSAGLHVVHGPSTDDTEVRWVFQPRGPFGWFGHTRVATLTLTRVSYGYC